MALNLNYQTAAEFSARFWARVQSAQMTGNKLELARLIWWVYSRVQAGDITNDQVRQSFNTAFGRSYTLTQWNNYVSTRIAPIKDRYQAMLDEAAL